MAPEATTTRAERLQGLAARALCRLPAWLQLRLAGGRPVVIDGQTLHPQVQLLLAIMRRLSGDAPGPTTPAEARAHFRREMRVACAAKTPVGHVRDLTIDGGAGPLAARHYAPGEDARALLVYLHGGGFVIGDLETHDEVCRLLCRHARTHVLAVDYRLAPEHPFPAAVEDALAALRWAQANAASLGADASRVGIGGDSAGGNLSAVATRLASIAGTPPAAQLLIYPATDAQAPHHPSKQLFDEGFFLSRKDCDIFYHRYTKGTGVAHDDPRVSPLRAADNLKLPPALVVTAGFDVLRDEGEAYAAKLRDAGTTVRAHRFEGLGHGFVNTTGISPAARLAVIQLARDWLALTGAD